MVNNLVDEDFKYLSKEFSDKYLELVKEKGVYPHEYMDSFKKFDKCGLPNKDAFFSLLNGVGISDKDCLRAKKVWNAFDIKNLGEYHDLYLKTDVLLLCDVFEKFIDVCLKYYGLDPCHYFSSSGLAWDAMLKMTGIELELISDVDVHLFIEKGMRGGISYIAKRYCKANNKYVKGYDASKGDIFIMYFDANNLYGWAMMQYLPYGGFKWMNKEEIDDFHFTSVICDSCEASEASETSRANKMSEGSIFEVELEYPHNLHNFHIDYPLAPEKLRVKSDMLSKYCTDIAKKYEIKVGNVNKLIPNLGDKERYVLHYRNLQLYLSLGMKVVKVYRTLKFNQSNWLHEFVQFNTKKRMRANNDFEKDFFELIINCVYSKTM